MEVKIVLGHAFGDEGKGVTVQWLCKEAIAQGKKPIVVRFSGGAQAGHTIVNNGITHICSSFGSGVLLGVPTAYTESFYFDPICFMREYKHLKRKGIKPIYALPDECCIVTPMDVFAGANDQKVRKDGTCGKGIYKAFKRSEDNGTYDTINDYDEGYANKIYDNAKEYYAMQDIGCRRMFTTAYDKAIAGNSVLFLSNYDVIIFEGSQGLLLDMDCGFYPHVTPSHTGLAGVPTWYLQDAEVYLVTRSYLTRHGNGYEPKFKHGLDLSKKYESNVENEFQGRFKTGALETSLLNLAYQRHCIDNMVAKYNLSLNLVVTHMDVIGDTWLCEQGALCEYETKRLKTSTVLNAIRCSLDYKPDHVYFNDSVESNIKRFY